MFSGGGGLSEGFFRSGYEFVSHIEMNRYASMTLETRALYHHLDNKNDYYAYLKSEINRDHFLGENEDLSKQVRESVINEEISSETKTPIIKKVKNKMNDMDIDKIDGIIGGPPCQAYSVIGRSRSPDCMKNDPRNYLYEYYVEFLKEFNPDFFIFENVPGMRSAKKGYILKDFKNKVNKLGYNTEAKILDAGNFNVLQSRKRLIIIGHKTDNSFFETIGTSKKKKYNVSSILNDLPILNPGQGTDSQQQYRKEKISGYLNNFNIRTKKDVLIHHQARKHNERDRKIYRLAINTWNKEKRRIKYKELPEDLKTHKNRKSFEDRFKVIAANSKSHTIVAHISKDGHYYIHPDIKQARSITVREAARIQSFPDNYKFEGPRTSQYVQVGNAVPPLMAENLAQKTKEFIDS